jgi:hypothetical protein
MDPAHVSYKEGYFHYEHGNLNISFGRETVMESCSLRATTITYVIQLSIMADSQSFFVYVTPDSCMYSNLCI